MKTRLLTNWNWIRVMYIIIGTLVAIQATVNEEWLGVLFGIYFSAMGLFHFGCAAGSCYVSPNENKKLNNKPIHFNEIKNS